MTRKLYNLIVGIVGGVETISIACVTYFVADATTATAVNASILIAGTAITEICSQFVKD